MTRTSTSRWLPFGPGHAKGIRLLCLPHAGAGAATYRAWGAGLPPEVGLCPIQPPGRESRSFEPPYRHVAPLVADLVDELDGILDTPYAVFGHSVGALVAFELVRQIRRSGLPMPMHLFVSGRHAPHLSSDQEQLRDLPTDELARTLAALGGTPSQVLADPDLLESIAPLLRADFSVNETYEYTVEAPLDVGITAFAATADARAERSQVAAWREHTSADFQLYLLPGGHFAVLKEAPFVHGRIAAVLASCFLTGPVSG
jgi:medium-chain acyl-[acyl-carrier-protein] hydrolase